MPETDLIGEDRRLEAYPVCMSEGNLWSISFICVSDLPILDQ